MMPFSLAFRRYFSPMRRRHFDSPPIRIFIID